MSDTIHWRVSCALNAALRGDPTQPLCARIWSWRPSRARSFYGAVMDWCFPRDAATGHCRKMLLIWTLCDFLAAFTREDAPCA